ncbi:VWA domain-containing protein [Bifidobacterium dolichotidis]|uniref:VWA domain-containing protein n=1 Tax=Bifidobacterium dolichotidis TaxID=2306976 RepID=A0A430FPJ1_9BIFI|nr:VWA domain-containing protein [Bifidobacterium dolichotidis]RSX54738.1 VWA domain-containing protein [Bifidobacterium dolichotidis]
MSKFTFSPSLGWPVGIILAVLMLGFAVASVVLYRRNRADSDQTLASCIRRTAICVLLAIVALTPSIATATTSRAISATDVVIATDVTGSMGVHDAKYGNDIQMSRIDAAKNAIHDITEQYPNSSFAALSFGATGTLDLPLTPDTQSVNEWARTLHPEETSSSAGSSLDTALDRLLVTLKSIHEQHPEDQLLLYIITDGEQTTPQTRRTFSSLRQYVNDACVIGVGSEEGGKVPQPNATSADQWVIDPSTGEPGISKMDKAQITELADELSGSPLFLNAQTTVANSQIAQQANKWRVTETEHDRMRISPITWPFAIALAVLLVWEAASWIVTSRRLL